VGAKDVNVDVVKVPVNPAGVTVGVNVALPVFVI